MDDIPESAGRSSFNLLDEKIFFQSLDIQPGITLLDLACGLGNYAVAASPHIGPHGFIHAFDLWEEGIETLQCRAAMAGITNIRAETADIRQGIPVNDHSVDLCLMATFIHILIDEKKIEILLREVLRVLKPAGMVAIVEFKKIEGPPGPPLSMRHSPLELAAILRVHDLRLFKDIDVGPYNYLTLFSTT